MSFPIQRLRRLRMHSTLRKMVQESHVTAADLIMPLFVRPGEGERRPIVSMPGMFQLSVDELVKEVNELEQTGVMAIILFGIPEHKDPAGSEGYAEDGVIQRALRALREKSRDTVLITDVCLCEYTDHGHCGLVEQEGDKFEVANDPTLELLARMAVSHVQAGADMVAPSDMMDGRIGAVREALDAEGFDHTPIMAYSAKYESGFYGPFRDAAESPPQFGDRSTYQMPHPNSDEAMREIALDIDEGADIVMVKPALAYLDIIRRAKQEFNVPLACFSVSGEYAMVKAAVEKGWLDERRIVEETLTAFKRAGADLILTYWAGQFLRWNS